MQELCQWQMCDQEHVNGQIFKQAKESLKVESAALFSAVGKQMIQLGPILPCSPPPDVSQRLRILLVPTQHAT